MLLNLRKCEIMEFGTTSMNMGSILLNEVRRRSKTKLPHTYVAYKETVQGLQRPQGTRN